MKASNTLSMDRAAVILMIVLIGLTALTAVLGSQAGVNAAFPGGEIGPYDPLTITFFNNVDPSVVESTFTIQPEIIGTFKWVDERTLQFTPRSPFQSQVDYQVQMSTGGLRPAVNGSFRIRAPLIAYLVSEKGNTDIWVMNTKGEARRNLTNGDYSILTFDTDRNGEFLVFAAFNEDSGIDLWRMDREGINVEKVLACGVDRCSAPTISPDGTRIAYVRENFVGMEGLPYGSPRIWLVDLSAGSDSPVYEDEAVMGYGPVWSPSGTYLVSHNGATAELRILDLKKGQEFIFPSETGKPFTWAPSERKFLYTDLIVRDETLYTRVRSVEIIFNKAFPLFGDNDEFDHAYGSLAWSPMENKVVLGFRTEVDNPAQVFWYFDIKSLDGQMIANEPGYTYSDPVWDPWGSQLVFQQFKLREEYYPEIALWRAADNTLQVLASGTMAQWLP